MVPTLIYSGFETIVDAWVSKVDGVRGRFPHDPSLEPQTVEFWNGD